MFGSAFVCDDPSNRINNITYPSSDNGISISRRRWRITGLLNTEETRDVSSDHNKVEVILPVTLLDNKNYTVGNKHKFSLIFTAWSDLTGIDVVALQYAVKEKEVELSIPEASDPTLVEVTKIKYQVIFLKNGTCPGKKS